MLIPYQNTPVMELGSIFEQYRVRLFVKREDLNHPFVSGNKWWKLRDNLEQAARNGKRTLLTFGGAYSNHLLATAAAARELGFESVGIVRGEETVPLNSTLSFARDFGMKLHYISRENYRRKNEAAFLQHLRRMFGDFYSIPEGGTNELAVAGCADWGRLLLAETDFDFVCLPVGTGGTVAGLVSGLDGRKKVIGFPVLKGAEFLSAEIAKFTHLTNWQLIHDYHFGGYAKNTPVLSAFIERMEKAFNLPLEFVYSGKALFGVVDLLEKKFFPPDSRILFLHTGGLRRLVSDYPS